ncbi:hypothetical protein JKG47_17925 [Acidithiobacillus sp. MC6.1]|nr:hypothetical protein [Acidithiobacillus sp. MC6.1]
MKTCNRNKIVSVGEAWLNQWRKDFFHFMIGALGVSAFLFIAHFIDHF